VQRGTRKVRTPNPCKRATSPLTAHHPHSPLTTTSKGTHPHRCERLLAGWIVGANGHVNDNGGTTRTHPGTTRRPPPRLRAAARRVVCGCVPCRGAMETRDGEHQHPPPTPVSTCSQGGSGATGHVTPPPPMGTTGTTTDDPSTSTTRRTTHHPPPAP
jgi:hypothetical protein